MERTQNQAWTELRDALQQFLTLQENPQTTIEEMTAARHKIEILERELTGLNEKKVA
jgi:hypothetical protein